MQPRVSVIVRTKDRPVFLARALGDIAAQTLTDLEVVVVNDGGDSEVVSAVITASALADRARVLAPEAPGGRCAAANAGIRAALAPYVVLHDDDDLWHPEFLARTAAVLDATGEAGVMTATEIVYEELREGRWTETAREPFWAGMTGVSFTTLLEVNRAVPISFLYRRSLHDELGGYDETLDAVEDWEFYLRIAARHPIAFLGGTPLAYWTQRPGVSGVDGNSMFELAALHERDDLAVRDRALREWVLANGAGLPLYIGLVERRLLDRMDALEAALAHETAVHSPVWTSVRRVRRSLIDWAAARRR